MLNNDGIFAKTKKLTVVSYYCLKPTILSGFITIPINGFFFFPDLGSNSVYPEQQSSASPLLLSCVTL